MLYIKNGILDIIDTCILTELKLFHMISNIFIPLFSVTKKVTIE